MGNQGYATVSVCYKEVCTQGSLRYLRTEMSIAELVLMGLSPYDASFIYPLLLSCLVASFGHSPTSLGRYVLMSVCLTHLSFFCRVYGYFIDIDDVDTSCNAEACCGSSSA